ncbi:MAG: diguanylate cyclase [Anaerolineae bacterium]|nr:diguanylate cyclase [Anaerolineae bacterium]
MHNFYLETTHLILCLGSIIVLARLLFTLRSHLRVSAPRAVVYFGIVLIGWLVSVSLETILNLAPPPVVQVLNRLSQSFFIMIPISITYLADSFASHKKFLNRRLYLVFGGITFLQMALLWTNQFHLLYWKQERLINTIDGILIFTRETSAMAVLNTTYEVLILFSLFHFLHLVIQMGDYYRPLAKAAIFTLVTAAIATALNLVKPFGFHYDYLPIAYTAALYPLALFITKHQIFDLVPISRLTYFDSIGDGALVIDRNGRILDVNQQGLAILNTFDAETATGIPIAHYFPAWTETLYHVINDNELERITHRFNHNGNDNQYDIIFQPFANPEGLVTNVLVTFQNVTFYSQLLAQLHELAIRDPLTNILNRRHFELLVRDHLRLAQRYHRSCSLILFDLNDFKNLNDHHGHPIGDASLTHFSRLVHQQLRESDIFARYGGDEFVLFLPETDLDGTLTVLENLWELLQGTRYMVEGSIVHLQTSAGVSCASSANTYDYDELIYQADRSLYASKEIEKCSAAFWEDHRVVCYHITSDHLLRPLPSETSAL